MLATCHYSHITSILGSTLKAESENKLKCFEMFVARAETSKENIDVLANKVHSVITKSCEAACPMRKSLCKKDNIWWNSELVSLQKEAYRTWKKAIKTEKGEYWEAENLARAYSKKAVRRAKRDSWHGFVESMNNQTPTD